MATFEEQIKTQLQQIITHKHRCLNQESERIYNIIKAECAVGKKSFTFRHLHWFNKYSKVGITYFTVDEYQYLGHKLIELSRGQLKYKVHPGGLLGIIAPSITIKRIS
jgi:hypothetical protein